MQGDILHSYGSLLFGALFAYGLSGVVLVQCLMYWRMYPQDPWPRKAMVAIVWLLDVIHSACIAAAVWDYFIIWFGNEERIDHIPWPVAVTVVITAAQTLINHFFFIHRIWLSSNKNYYISIPLAFLVLARIACACVSTSEMIMLHSYTVFTHVYPGWIFTTGLTLSAICDILITSWLCFYLIKMRERTNRSGTVRMVDQLTVYTIENGALTCVVTTISLICWLTMKTNLIFLGLHFVIGKLYANSLLAALNTRRFWRRVQVRFDKGAQRTSTYRRSKEISTLPFPVLTTQSVSTTLPTRRNTLNFNLTYPDSVYQFDDRLSTPGTEECTSRHWAHQHPDPDEDDEDDVDVDGRVTLKKTQSRRATKVVAMSHQVFNSTAPLSSKDAGTAEKAPAIATSASANSGDMIFASMDNSPLSQTVLS